MMLTGPEYKAMVPSGREHNAWQLRVQDKWSRHPQDQDAPPWHTQDQDSLP